MRWIPLLLLFFLSPSACSHLPHIESASSGSEPEIRKKCHGIYPRGDWQLVHSLSAITPDGGSSTMMGITRLSATHRSIHCVLLTLEGMVLFEARSAGSDTSIEVLRALPPFDSPAFAKGIFDDITLMLLPPAATMIDIGRRSDQALVCRWQMADGSIQDNVFSEHRNWQIRRYSVRNRLLRQVTATSDGDELARSIHLKAFGLLGYELTLTLLEAQSLESHLPDEKESP